jgi:antitoxin ParD1/3/4
MSKTMTLNVRVSGTLGAFVAANVGENGAYENVSEYVRDLIRRDKARAETEAFERLRAELVHAFAAPDGAYAPLDADAVIRRNARREIA